RPSFPTRRSSDLPGGGAAPGRSGRLRGGVLGRRRGPAGADGAGGAAGPAAAAAGVLAARPAPVWGADFLVSLRRHSHAAVFRGGGGCPRAVLAAAGVAEHGIPAPVPLGRRSGPREGGAARTASGPAELLRFGPVLCVHPLAGGRAGPY